MQSAHALAATVAIGVGCLIQVANAGEPFASAVFEYVQGANPATGFTNQSAALGEPTRFTGVGVFPSVVSPFSPPFMPEEVVSIGAGGHITLTFDPPIADDPSNPFGIDFLIFSNNGFIDGDFPNGFNLGAFGNDPYTVEVSNDGTTWHTVAPASADVLFPTCGYIDSGPFDASTGTVLTDFTKPVDPAITSADLFMLSYAELLELYDGSGGGAGFDLSTTSLGEVAYVRISNPGNPKVTASVEIDAIVNVAPAGSLADIVSSDTFLPPGDGVVDGADLGFLLVEWGRNPGSPADIVTNATLQPPGDGKVDGADLAYMLGEWSS